MSEQPQHPDSPERTAEASDFGQLLQFPGAPTPPAAPASTPEVDPNEDAADSAGIDDEPGTDLDVDDTERAPERLVDAPHRAPHIPAALRAAGTRTWDVSKRAGRASVPVAKTTARHGYYLTAGAWDTIAVPYSRMTGRDIDARIDAAQAAGDHGTAAQLMAQRNESRKILIERIKLFGKFLKHSPKIAGGLMLVSLATVSIVSVVAFVRPGGMNAGDVWLSTFTALASGWEWITWLGTTVVPWTVAALAAGLLITGYNKRRLRGDAPEWAAPQCANVPVDEVQVTSDRLITALKNCGISELKNAIKAGETAGMVDLISQYGPGVTTTITLPRGIPASKLAERADSIASSLSRGEHEIVISRSPNNNSQATLWVARPGALDEPVDASPLMSEDYGQVDLYRDHMPWGISPMGDPVAISLLQRHIVLAGLSKQGKTASARALALWAALDPSVELRISDLKGVGDWSMFAAIASTLIEGSGDEEELATCDMVEGLVSEMLRRKRVRKDRGYKGDITSKEAKDGSGDFHPIIGIIDEVQIAYMSQACAPTFDEEGNVKPGRNPVGGQKNTSRLWQAAKALHDQARAVNIHLWEFAQNPTDKNLPAIVREGAHLRASLYVSSENIARMAVGDPVVDSGGAPHRLRNEIDAGTIVLAGANEAMQRGQMSQTVRTHYISTEAAYTVADRAREIREAARNPVATSDGDVTEERDVLADVVKVLKGEELITAKQCSVRLAELAPSYYQGWTGKGLHEHLKDSCDVDPGVKDGTPVVRLKRVQAALSGRADDE